MNKEQNTTSRIEYIDVFRSIGIILMIMGHIGFGDRFDFFIHAFHIPMFFIISGFFFRPRSKEEFPFSKMAARKAKSLLLPYIIFGLGYYLLYVLLQIRVNAEIELSPLKHILFVNTWGLPVYGGMPICGALWFLTALFFTDNIFFLLDRYVKDRIIFSIIVVIIALTGNMAKDLFPFILPYALSESFVGVGLYYIGYIIKCGWETKVIHCLTHLNWIPCIILGMVTAVLIFANGYVNMRDGTYSIIPLFWINAVSATVVILNFSRLIYPWIENMFLGKWLRGIGKDAIAYVCLNQVVILFVTKLMNKFLVLPERVNEVVILLSVLCVLYVADQVIMKTHLKFILGK